MSQYYTVRTPENVAFEFELGGLGRRALAQVLDLALMAVVALVLSWLVLGVLSLALGGFAFAVFFLLLLVLQWGYGMGLEWRYAGQTFGKRVFGLRAIDVSGRRLTFEQAAVRNLLRVVDLLPGLYFIGGLAALLSTEQRRLGDLAAGTVVVRTRKTRLPALGLPHAELDESILSSVGFRSARQRTSAPARAALFSVVERRAALPDPVRARLFAGLAAHFEESLGVTRPPHLSPERFSLHLAAVLDSRLAVTASPGRTRWRT